jgi:hypothetical protein
MLFLHTRVKETMKELLAMYPDGYEGYALENLKSIERQPEVEYDWGAKTAISAFLDAGQTAGAGQPTTVAREMTPTTDQALVT